MTIMRAGREEDARPPEPKKDPKKKSKKRIEIHPGLQQYGMGIRCRSCGDFLEWGFLLNGNLIGNSSYKIAVCGCGLWVKGPGRLEEVRWIRFSSKSFMIGDGGLYAPRERKVEERLPLPALEPDRLDENGEDDEEPLG